MSNQFKYTKDDNTDRDFPDALEVIDMEFKINGEYVCIEPCGGGAKHLLGDQYIYVDINGDDFFPDERDQIRTGTENDPFATIERAIGYANSFVTLGGNIYINVGAGTFYVDDTISIDHPNKIIIQGTNVVVSSIHFEDMCISEFLGFWFGEIGIFGVGINGANINMVSLSIDSNTTVFGGSTFNLTYGGVSNVSRGVLFGNASYTISYITFSILSDETIFGDVSYISYSCACGDGTTGIIFSGYINIVSQTLIESINISVESDATTFGDLSVPRYAAGACSNGTTGICAAGYNSFTSEILRSIEKITIASLSNATGYGLLSEEKKWTSSLGDRTYGLFNGMSSSGYNDKIEKIVINIDAMNSHFGNLSISKTLIGTCANDTIGLFGGGYTGSVFISLIEKVIISIDSNSTNFGDFIVNDVNRNIAICNGCSGN